MINLSIQPYCEKCGDFEPEVEKKQYTKIFMGIANATQR